MEKRERFAALDGLRAVFGMGIVIYHVNGAFGSAFSGVLAPVYAYGGYFGNYFFFLLSGFLTEFHKLPIWGWPFARLRRRLGRLYSVYALSNLAMMASGTVTLSLWRTCATFLMLSSAWTGDTPYNLPGWFFCVWMLCEVFYALLDRLREHAALRRGLCLALAAGGAALEKLDLGVPLLYRVCGEGYLNFFLGVLLAEWLGDGSALRENRGKAWGLFCGLVGAVAGLTALTGFSELPGDMRWWVTLLCAGLLVAVLPGGRIVRPLTRPGLTALGRCSLPLLLWHVPLARYWNRLAGWALEPRVSFLLYLVAAVAAAFGSQRYLERLPRWDKGGIAE